MESLIPFHFQDALGKRGAQGQMVSQIMKDGQATG
jgi:hypothetical protein